MLLKQSHPGNCWLNLITVFCVIAVQLAVLNTPQSQVQAETLTRAEGTLQEITNTADNLLNPLSEISQGGPTIDASDAVTVGPNILVSGDPAIRRNRAALDEGDGSEFYNALTGTQPLSGAAAEGRVSDSSAALNTAALLEATTRPLRIFIYDDYEEEGYGGSLREYLESRGHYVTYSHDNVGNIDVWARYSEYDVILAIHTCGNGTLVNLPTWFQNGRGYVAMLGDGIWNDENDSYIRDLLNVNYSGQVGAGWTPDQLTWADSGHPIAHTPNAGWPITGIPAGQHQFYIGIAGGHTVVTATGGAVLQTRTGVEGGGRIAVVGTNYHGSDRTDPEARYMVENMLDWAANARPASWFWPSESAQRAFPGTVVSHSLHLVNRGGEALTFTLSAGGNAWPTSVADEAGNPITSTGLISDGGRIDLVVRVQVPLTATTDAQDWADVTAVAALDPAIMATARVRTSTPGSPHRVDVVANTYSVPIGGTAVVTATVTDREDSPVVNGTVVTLSVGTAGTLNPISGATLNGIVTATFTAGLTCTLAHVRADAGDWWGSAYVSVGATGPTDIASGDITTDTLWSACAGPYLVHGDVTVNPGVTLTVEAGSQVRFDDNTGLFILGTLDVPGSSDAHVLFTSNSDAPTPGLWKGLVYGDAANAAAGGLAYAAVSFAGQQHNWNGSNYAAGVLVYSGAPHIQHSLIHRNAGYGVWAAYDSLPSITANTIEDNASGINMSSAYLLASDAAIPAGDSADVEWRYLALATPGAGWQSSLIFDDSTWSTGRTPFCDNEGCKTFLELEGGTMYARKVITPDFPLTTTYYLRAGRDDMVTVWVNGVAVFTDTRGGGAQWTPYILVTLTPGANLIAAEMQDSGRGANNFDLELLGGSLQQATLAGNTLHGNGADGGPSLYIGNSSPLVAGNEIWDNHASGVLLGGYSWPVIRNNRIHHNDGSGIEIGREWPGGGPYIYNNTIDSNQGYGIWAAQDWTAQPTIHSNLVTRNGQDGINCRNGHYDADVSYNDAWDNPANYSGCTLGTGNISREPLYLDPAQADYHLQLGSPAINAGNPDPASNNVDDTRNDIGAYGGPGGQSYTYVDVRGPVVEEAAANPAVMQPGNQVAITARVWDPGGVAWATAEIETPDETTVVTLTLRDDGLHGDGASGDGLYGNTWTTVAGEHTYLVDVLAADGAGRPSLYDNAATFRARYSITYTVTSTADSGPGTLRQRLAVAQAGDVILFDTAVFSPAHPATITLLSGLPEIAQGYLTIDASAAGVILDGFSAPGGACGLSIASSGNTVRGLQILRFPASGICIHPSAQNNVIGGSTPGARNVLGGNGRHGISIDQAAHNTISGNYIGVDAGGSVALPNWENGVDLTNGASDNLIGGDTAAERNLIFANHSSGVNLWGSTTASNTVRGNWIGLGLAQARQAFPSDVAISPNYANDCTLYAATLSTGAHKSTDCGQTWAEVNTGLTESRLMQIEIPSDAANANTAYVLAENGYLFATTDGAAHWSLVSTALEGIDRRNLVLSAGFSGDHTMYAAAEWWSWREMGGGSGVFKSTDGGVNWTRVTTGMSNNQVWKVIASPDPAAKDTLFALTQSSIEKSTDGGAHWSAIARPDGDLTDLALSPNFSGDHTLFATAGSGRVYVSTNGGASWSGVDALRGDPRHMVVSPNFANDHQVCHGGGWNDSIYCSSDGGSTWTRTNTGLSGGLNDTAILFSPHYASDGTLFVASLTGMAQSTDRGATWRTLGGLHTPGNTNGVGIGGGAHHNTIGPDNVISNNHFGVSINDGDTSYNVVAGNLIGSDPTGTFAQSNGDNGIAINGGHHNLLGGDAPDERNIVTAIVTGEAIRLNGSETLSNTASGNYIGTNISGTLALGSSGNGVAIHGGACYNVVGGATPGAGNLISGNNSGVSVWDSDTRYNTISGNTIGLNAGGSAALPNRSNGIEINNGASHNVIGGNVPGAGNRISGNAWGGVRISGDDTLYNTIAQNSIYDNGGSGIELAGGNAELAAPVLTQLDQGAGTASGSACANCLIEIFSDGDDEGRIYEGTTTANAGGAWTFTKDSALAGPHVTATATDGQGNTSEFSPVPYIRVNQSHDWVDGQTTQGQAQVQLTLLDSGGNVKGSGATSSDENGWFNGTGFYTTTGNVDVAAGDVVSVSVGPGYIITAQVVAMTGAVDIAADTVTGQVPGASAGQQIRVEIFELPHYPGDATGTLQAGGYYTVHLAFDIREGHMVAIWYRNAQGNWIGIIRHWLGIQTKIGANDVWGNTAPNSTMQLTLTTAAGALKGSATATSDGEGGYWTGFFSGGQPAPLAPGDRISATAGSRSTFFDVPALTGVIDFDADAVCGIAPAGSEIYVNLWSDTGWGYRSDWIHADATGHYCVAVGFDLHPGHQGEVMYYDERGHHAAASLTYEERLVTPLALGVQLTGTVGALVYSDYALEIGAGERLLLEVTPSSGIGQVWLYGRLNGLPSRTQYDLRTLRTTATGSYELLIAPTRAGTYYFSLFGWDITGAQGHYTIVARTLDRRLSDVQPRSAGNTGEATLMLQGLGFVNGMRVELRRAGSVVVSDTHPMLSSYTTLSARFDLHGVTPAAYDVAAVWPGGARETLSAAFQVYTGTVGAQLEASLESPDFVRPGRTFVLWLNYANTGDTDMVAPLFIVSNPISAPMRLAESEPFAEQPVQVLGINSDGLAGNLPPGAMGRIPIYFQVPPGTPGHAMLDFHLDVMISDTLPISWTQVEAEVRPPDVDPQVWAVLWPNLTAQIGSTWGDYRQALADNASYLSLLGRNVYSVRDLFIFEVRKALGMNPRQVLAGELDAACPSPGLALEFGRAFPGSLEGRFYQGPLGRGWNHSYDIYLTQRANGDVLLNMSGSLARLFRGNGDGSYSALPGDYGVLTYTGSIYQLVEQEGVTYRFRSDLKLDYVQDRNGNRITLVYNGSGQLIRAQHSNGEHLDFAYNAQGLLAGLTDCAGRVIQYSYDASGEHLESVTAPGDRVTSYLYHAATGQPTDHALHTITYPDGRHQYYAYESLGRLSEEHLDGDAEQVRYTYDAFGRVQVTLATGQIIHLSPDEQGRPARLQDGLGRELAQQYDAGSNLTELTDPSGQSYAFDYDRRGNVIGSEDPLGQQVRLDYDYRFNQVSALEDARGNQSAFSYDADGNLAAITYPDGSRETFVHDADGNLTQSTDRQGQVITYTYTAQGQLQRKDYPDGSWVAYAYDAAGNLTAAVDISGTISMEYDADTNLLTRITYPSGHWFTFSYDDGGRRTQRVGDDGYTLNYHYDPAGRLERITDGSSAELVRYEYDAAGRMVKESKGNGTYTTYSYDAAGQLLHLVNYALGGAVQSRFDYTYDANGNRTSMATLASTTTYEYDVVGQLTGVTYPGGRHVTYAYDAAGNRTTVADDGTPTAYTANSMNQYTQVGVATYLYDANGNMISQTNAGGTTTFVYDFENRLVRVSEPDGDIWEYTYDALGNRVATIHNGAVTRYVHDPVGLVDVAAEYDGSGALAARYVHGAGLVARIDAAGNPAYYAFDAIGNARQLTQASGAVANVYDYDPYGIPLQANETISNPFRYVGRLGVMYEGNGLNFMRARYYFPALGQFISDDPAIFGGGDINTRRYVWNNPLISTDPQGLGYFAKRPLKGWPGMVNSPIDDRLNTELSHEHYFFDDGTNVGFGPQGRFVETDPSTISQYEPSSGRYDDNVIREALKKMKDQPYWIVPFGPNTENCQEWAERLRETQEQLQRTQYDQAGPENITSDDPNEKVGPAGEGAERAVQAEDELYYVVYFENRAEASAPAQQVLVVDNLDPDLDWTTFRVTEIAWGDQVLAVPEETGAWSTRQTVADYRPEEGQSWWVDVQVRVDYETGRVLWDLRTLDPQTGELPLDPFAGFLPPNDATDRGQGYVAFTIRPRADLPVGTHLDNQATIIFDTNQPIETNAVWNTIAGNRIFLPLVVRNK